MTTPPLVRLASNRAQLELLGVKLGGVDADARTLVDAAAIAEATGVGAPDALNGGSLLPLVEALGDCAWLAVETAPPEKVFAEETVADASRGRLADTVGAEDPSLVAEPEGALPEREALDVADELGNRVVDTDGSSETELAAIEDTAELQLGVETPDGLGVMESEVA